jgi:adenylate kinase family enzyme
MMMDCFDIGNRIIILGCSGSGKSTFAKKLHEYTALPLIHLDNIWWNKDRTHISREEFDCQLKLLLQGDEWIIDGDYSRTYEVRIQACDTIIFLDYNEEECMKGIIERVGKSRSDIPWVEQQLDPELVKLVRNYQTDNRPVLYSLIAKYPEKKSIVFKTRSQSYEWLSEMTGGLHEADFE